MTLPPSPASGQRRHPRIATRMPAYVEVGEARYACEIRDYCQTGLNIAFVGDVQPPTLPKHTPLLVEFTAGTGLGAQRFRILGRAAHQRPDGVGVFVGGMPGAALRALGAAAAAAMAPGETAQADKLSAASALDLPADTIAHLLQVCHQRYFVFLADTLRDFFLHAGVRLREASFEVSFIEQASYIQAAQELEPLRARLENQFLRALRERLSALESGQETANKDANATNELALVDENEFEDWLALSSVSDRIETVLAAQLNEFELRYGLLLSRPVTRETNPFRPRVICQEFGALLRETHFGPGLRAVLYKAFGQALERHLTLLLKELDTLLQPVQPPREPKRVIPRNAPHKDSSEADASNADADAEALAAKRLSNLYRQSQTGLLAGTDGVEFSLERLLAGQTRAPLPGASPGPLACAPTLTHVAQDLQQAMQPQTAPRQLAHGQPVEVAELLRLIDRLTQAEAQGIELSRRIQAELEAILRERHIAPAYQQALDMTARLFERAQAEHPTVCAVESLLKRLEPALLKLTLRDGSFLDNTEHPARRVVNLIDEFAIACNDQGAFFDARLQRFLTQWVDRLASAEQPTSTHFASAIEPLEKALQPLRQARASRIARLQEACEARERIRQARARVNAALENRFGGRRIPLLLLRLIELGWRQHLVLLEMRLSAAHPSWQEALDKLDELYAWLMASPAASSAEINAAQRRWLRQVERWMTEIQIDRTAIATLIDDLVHALGLGVEADPELRASIELPFGKFAQPEQEESNVSLDALLDELRIGDWWSFSLNGRWQPMQLIWLAQPPTSAAFANRAATEKLELELSELLRQRRAGLARLSPDFQLPLLDRSEYALLDDSLGRMLHQVTHDPLTGLLNRKGFMQRLHRIGDVSTPEQVHAIGLIEFDGCRLIYTSCGVEAGDALLRELTAEVRARLRPEDVLARLSENTFAILLPDSDRAAGMHVMERLLRHLREYRFHHGQEVFGIGPAMGLAEYRPALHDANEAMRDADAACMAAKAAGGHAVHVYEVADAAMQAQEALIEWAGKIDRILAEDRLFLRAQKIIPINPAAGLLPYYEILLGIRDETGELIPPAHFIPAIERWNRSSEIDLWVMRHAFAWMRRHRELLESIGGLAINLSALSLNHPDILDFLHAELEQENLPAHKIIFEITESTAIASYVKAQEFMRQIRRYGCKFSLDDFGSGYASYAQLKNLRTDTLKIDGSFIKDLAASPDDFAMVRSINDIGHSLGMRTVAEFVASADILDKLRQIGVDYAQGYVIHVPAPLDTLIDAMS